MPKKSKTRGFTLVELLVVVAIIAILSVIGMAVFGGIQANARDARRKADIDAIANAMEANYGKTTAGQYDSLADNMFSAGKIPLDPINTESATDVDNTCPSQCKYCVKEGLETDTTVTAGACKKGSDAKPTGGAKPHWYVCANLEKGSYYCRGNVQ